MACTCCSHPPCCPGLPTTQRLFATLATGVGCACAGGTSGTLTYNGATGKWEGSVAMGTCGHVLNLAFYYIGGATTVADARLDTTWQDACRAPFLAALPNGSTSACNPCSIAFAVDVDVACGCTVPGAEFQVTVSS